jgi:hypothetical protein
VGGHSCGTSATSLADENGSQTGFRFTPARLVERQVPDSAPRAYNFRPVLDNLEPSLFGNTAPAKNADTVA